MPHRSALGLLILAAAALPALGQADTAGALEGRVTLEPAPHLALPMHYRMRTRAPILDPDPPRAIVYLEPADGAYPDAEGVLTADIDQEGYQFRPGVAAVRVGTQVSFPNRDDEFHSVFSYSSVKRFDLGRFRRDEDSPPVLFDRPGLVKVYCEIHKHMRGLLLVLDTPWFTATDESGRYEIRDVPPGDYRVHAFLPTERTLERPVTIPSGGTVRVDLAP
jgi:plastocyanin